MSNLAGRTAVITGAARGIENLGGPQRRQWRRERPLGASRQVGTRPFANEPQARQCRGFQGHGRSLAMLRVAYQEAAVGHAR